MAHGTLLQIVNLIFQNGKDNDYTHDAPQNGYLARKKVYADDNPKTGSWKWRQVFLYRLSSVYLDYAEALNEAYDNTASREEALEYVNKVRERAGVRKYMLNGSDTEDYIHADDSQEAVRNLLEWNVVLNYVVKVQDGWISDVGRLLMNFLKCVEMIMEWILEQLMQRISTKGQFFRLVYGRRHIIGFLFILMK